MYVHVSDCVHVSVSIKHRAKARGGRPARSGAPPGARLVQSDVRAVQPQLRGVFAIPAEPEQRVLCDMVWQPDTVPKDGTVVAVGEALPAATCNHGRGTLTTARVLGAAVEPCRVRCLAAPAGGLAVWMHRALLARDVRAPQHPLLKASLESRHLTG